MADFEFRIPVTKEFLLNVNSDNIYYVKKLCAWSSLKEELRRAHDALQYEGPSYVLDHFNIYFAVLYYGEKVSIKMLSSMVVDLENSCILLVNYLKSLLNEVKVKFELQIKLLNVMKMSVYLYTNALIALENKFDEKNKQNLNVVTKILRCNKRKYISILVKMLHLNNLKLWEPPVCDETFINLFAEVGFTFLQNPLVNVKADSKTINMIFIMFSVLLKSYNYSRPFIVRLTKAVKVHEHLAEKAARGVAIFLEVLDSPGLIREVVRELSEWHTHEPATKADATASRHCSSMLVELTRIKPWHMLPELEYMLHYLAYPSHTLRNFVLSIIMKVVLYANAVNGMNKKWRNTRDKLLDKLRAHVLDVHPDVRVKALQHWTVLCQASTIPTGLRTQLVSTAVTRLQDTASNVRCAAMQLLVAYIEHNLLLTNNLNLNELQMQLQTRRDNLEGMQAALRRGVAGQEWLEIEPRVRAAVQAGISVAKEHVYPDNGARITLLPLQQMIREFIRNGRYGDAFELCCATEDRLEDDMMATRFELEAEGQVEFFVTLMCCVYVESQLITEKLTEWQLTKWAIVELENVCEQLREIDTAIVQLKNLLHSDTISEMHEAIRFFVVASAFKIKRASEGMTAMLILIRSTDKERRKAVMNAYKNVFLGEEQSRGAPIEIANNLVSLMETVTLEREGDLRHIVAEWARNGKLEGGVMKHLWTLAKHAREQRVAALQVLYMAAHGRKTIIECNMNLVGELAFPATHTGTDDDMRMVLIGCQMLSLMYATSNKPPFRLPTDHAMFQRLFHTMYTCMTMPQTRLSSLVSTALNDLVLNLCRKPDVICIQWMNRLFSSVLKQRDSMTPSIELSRFVHLLGEMAMRQFMFLNVTMYRKLKRCAHSSYKCSKNARSMNMTSKASASSYRQAPLGELDMEGTTVILKNNEVLDDTLLNHYTVLLLAILCNEDGRYDDGKLQAAACLALAKFMMMSSLVCEQHLRQVMTVLERSQYRDTRPNVLVAMSELLHRHPSIVHPHIAARTTAVTTCAKRARHGLSGAVYPRHQRVHPGHGQALLPVARIQH